MTGLSLWSVGVGGRTLVLVAGFLNVIVLTRALGPFGRGQYFLFGSLLVVATTLADLGLSQSVLVFAGLRDLPSRDVHRVLVRYGALFSALAMAGGAAVILAAGAALLPNFPRQWALGALLVVPVSLYVNYWTAMMTGLRRLVSVNAVQLGAGLAALAADLVLVVPTGDTAVAIVIYVAVLAGEAAVMLWIQRRSAAERAPTEPERPGLGREMLRFGLHGYPNSVGGLLWSRAAVFVLNVFHGPAVAGVYSVAQQLAERVLLPIQALQDVIYNRMIQLPRAEATRTMDRYLRLGIALMLPVSAIAILASPIVVTWLFSDAFARAIPPLRILLVGSAVMTIPALLATYLLGHLRRPGLVSLLSWISGSVNLFLLLTFVPGEAEVGAATAAVATQVASTAAIVALYLRLARTDLRSALVLKRADVALVLGQLREMLTRRSAR